MTTQRMRAFELHENGIGFPCRVEGCNEDATEGYYCSKHDDLRCDFKTKNKSG